MENTYPALRKKLQDLSRKFAASQTASVQAFSKLHHAALEPGALDRKTKELMAVAISISSRCKGCIAYHVHDALKAGASRPEVEETISVALMMGGGPSMIYGCEALEALEQFEEQNG